MIVNITPIHINTQMLSFIDIISILKHRFSLYLYSTLVHNTWLSWGMEEKQVSLYLSQPFMSNIPSCLVSTHQYQSGLYSSDLWILQFLVIVYHQRVPSISSLMGLLLTSKRGHSTLRSTTAFTANLTASLTPDPWPAVIRRHSSTTVTTQKYTDTYPDMSSENSVTPQL